MTARSTSAEEDVHPFRDPEHRPGRALRILLAEDTPGNQMIVASLLDRGRHQVDVAIDGREAVEKYRRQPYDLVLMDVMMPGLDGFQATAAIRSLEAPGGRRTPIVGLTAHNSLADRQRCLDSGMDDYLAKPVQVQDLLDVVERFTGGSDESALARPLDLRPALKRMGDDERLLAGVAQFFLDDAPELLRQLRSALDRADQPEAVRVAHTLKGLAANFDAHAAVAAARRIEQRAAAGELPDAAGILSGLETEVEGLRRALEPVARPARGDQADAEPTGASR